MRILMLAVVLTFCVLELSTECNGGTVPDVL